MSSSQLEKKEKYKYWCLFLNINKDGRYGLKVIQYATDWSLDKGSPECKCVCVYVCVRFGVYL